MMLSAILLTVSCWHFDHTRVVLHSSSSMTQLNQELVLVWRMILFLGDLPFDQTVSVSEDCWLEFLRSAVLSQLGVCIQLVLWKMECYHWPSLYHISRLTCWFVIEFIAFVEGLSTLRLAVTHQYYSPLKLMCNLPHERIVDLKVSSCLNTGPVLSVEVKVQEALASSVLLLEVDSAICRSMLHEQHVHCFEGFPTVSCTNHGPYIPLEASYLCESVVQDFQQTHPDVSQQDCWIYPMAKPDMDQVYQNFAFMKFVYFIFEVEITSLMIWKAFVVDCLCLLADSAYTASAYSFFWYATLSNDAY